MLTGGVAKYIAQLMDAGATDKASMLRWVTEIGTPFLSEGKERVTAVGHYWVRKGNNEIDIIALNDIDRTALVAEVKRNASRYDARLLQEKFESIKSIFGKYKETKPVGLSMEDM